MDNSNLPTVKNNAVVKLPQSDKVFFISRLTGSASVAFATYLIWKSFFISITTFVLYSLGLVIIRLVQKSKAAEAQIALTYQSSTLGKIEEIKKQVSKCKFLENVETEGTMAAQQADQLLHQYKSLKNMIGQKFNETEITYARYLENIDASCLAIAENLDQAKRNLNYLDAIASSKNETWESELNQVRQLLDKNGQALEQASLLFKALNETNTKEIYKQQLDQSLEQMKELTARAKNYSKN